MKTFTLITTILFIILFGLVIQMYDKLDQLNGQVQVIQLTYVDKLDVLRMIEDERIRQTCVGKHFLSRGSQIEIKNSENRGEKTVFEGPACVDNKTAESIGWRGDRINFYTRGIDEKNWWSICDESDIICKSKYRLNLKK